MLELLETYAAATLHVCGFSIIFGICVLLMSFCADLQQSLEDLTTEIEDSAVKRSKSSHANRMKLKNMLKEFIEFHSMVKQLSFH